MVMNFSSLHATGWAICSSAEPWFPRRNGTPTVRWQTTPPARFEPVTRYLMHFTDTISSPTTSRGHSQAHYEPTCPTGRIHRNATINAGASKFHSNSNRTAGAQRQLKNVVLTKHEWPTFTANDFWLFQLIILMVFVNNTDYVCWCARCTHNTTSSNIQTYDGGNKQQPQHRRNKKRKLHNLNL